MHDRWRNERPDRPRLRRSGVHSFAEEDTVEAVLLGPVGLDLTDMAVSRLVICNGFTRDLADLFLSDLDHHWRVLAGHRHDCPPLVPEGKRQSFAH
jgi:hypothetical protein